MAVSIDFVDGATIQEDESGYKAVRVARVTGLSGDKAQRMYDALNAPGVPVYNESHPVIPGIYCKSRSAKAQGPESAMVTLEYRRPDSNGGSNPDEDQIEIGSSVQESETNTDVNGDLLKVYYLPEDADPGTEEIEQVCTASVAYPQTVLRIRRKEGRSPEDKATTYTGTVNSTSWRGYDANTWLCRSIQGISNDGGDTYDVTYEFQLNWYYWQAKVVYIDSSNGETPGDVSEPGPGMIHGNGVGYYDMYPQMDFRNLGL